MNQKIFFSFLILITINFFIAAQAEDSPEQTLSDLINLFKAYNTPPKDGKLTPLQAEKNKEITIKFESIFYFPSMINGAFRDILPNMTKKQQTDFYEKFKTLIELVAYPQGSYFYSNSNNTIKKSFTRGKEVVVPSENYNYDKDRDVTINYVFQKINGRWVLVDAELNDHSLADEYRMQINRIVEKNGLNGLWELLVKKHEDLTK